MRSLLLPVARVRIVLVISLMLVVVSVAFAQTAQVKPRPQRATSVQVTVRDQSGNTLESVKVIVSGGKGNAVTDASGVATLPAPPDGAYRFRFEREGFIELEREVTIKGGRPAQIEVALRAAPPPPPPPPVEPPPPPSPPPPVAGGPPATVSIPTFLDKNFIGRDPLKESVLGCTPSATTRLLQLREGLAEHAHADLDEAIYVVAGEAAIRFKDQTTPLAPGGLAVIPRGVSHAVERRGKNPVVVLSVLSGAPCRTTPTTQ